MKECFQTKLQLELEVLTVELLETVPDPNTKLDREKVFGNWLNNACKKLSEIFKEDFRPHYFFVHHMMDTHETIRYSEVLPVWPELLEYLNENEEKIENYNNLNEKIKFDILMYFKAIEYEVHIKTDVNELIDEQKTVDKIKNDISDINLKQQELNQFGQNVESIKKNIDTVSDESKSVMSNAISVLGIFIGIVMGVFGGETVIKVTMERVGEIFIKNEALLNSNGDSIIILSIAFIMLMSFFVVNIIFIFMFLLSRLIDKDISIQCKEHNFTDDITKNHKDNDVYPKQGCINCVNNCCFAKKLKCRYSYVFYTEIILGIAFGALLLFWICKACFYDSFIMYLNHNFTMLAKSKIAMGCVTLLIVGVIIYLINHWLKNNRFKEKNIEKSGPPAKPEA